MKYIIKLLGLASGESSEFDGQYVRSYDPDKPGVSPSGRRMVCTLVTTSDRNSAKRYESFVDAVAEWKRVCAPPHHRRWDGKPNRPLTAYSFTVEKIGDGQ